LSENDASVALLSSIPIETVERIEIVRGGSSVLYGEGATAGTIQIITRRPQHQEGSEGSRSRGTVVADAGTFGQRGLRVALVREQQGWSLDTNLDRRETDNYRDNNRLRQENVSGGLQWADDSRRIGLRIDRLDQSYRTAGALTMAQYRDNPRSSFTPDDYGATGMTRAVLSAEQRMGAFELAAKLSQRDKTYSSHTVGSFGISDYATRSRTTQFSPRLRYTADIGKLHNELVTGFDISESARQAVSASSLAVGVQHSRALYARNEIRRNDGRARLAFGLRRETFDQRSTDSLAWNQNNNYAQSQALTAWDVAGSVAPLSRTTLFAKAGRSYRVANIDENGFTLQPGQMLRPQTSDDLAFGATLGASASRHALTLTLFQHHLRNEIMYDPTIANPATGGNGANVNLDPTLRRGVELEMRSQLTASFALSASFQHVDARFRAGANAGKEVVLTPRNTASTRLNWNHGPQSARAGAQWVASQRYGNDFANTCAARMPSYVTLDARYALRLAKWELALSGTNLGNKNYFSQAYGCASGIYPASGRQLDFSVRYDF
jgi:iron complex outermembrane receptor protein